jgi:hypothetical protein
MVLSPVSGSSNYPDATVVTNFGKIAAGSAPGETSTTYSVTATLLRISSGGGVSWLSGRLHP